MHELRLPSLGAEMEEGTLLEWYVKPGDRIEYGDVIALLDTEKAEIEMEAFEAGVVESLLIEPGQTVPVGTAIATLADAGSPATQEAPRAPVAEAAPVVRTVREATPESASSSAPQPLGAREHSRHRATPLARRLARERGIDLDRISGSGPGGAITQADIPSASTQSPEPSQTLGSAAPAQPVPTIDAERSTPRPRSTRPDRRREIIAAAMARSKREIPHYYLATSIEVERALAWIAARNEDRAIDDRVLLPALLIKSVARAAERFSQVNGHWRDGRFRSSSSVHVGMVVSLRDGGVVIPTIRDTQEKDLTELTRELRDVVGRARAGRLRSGELAEATISVTSLGERGAETLFGVIYPPQVAIVGFGGIHPGLHAEGDLLGTRSVVNATLSADHRASDGQEGSRFLDSIARGLGDPESL